MKKSILLIALVVTALVSYSQQTVSLKDARTKVATAKKATGLEVVEHSNFALTPSAVNSDVLTVAAGLTYDWQSNAGAINRAYTWEDGTTGVAWTHSRLEGSFTDRGTGVNFFDGTAWVGDPDVIERVENERTGFGAYAPWGPNGEVTVAHSGAGYLVISMRENKGEGEWTYLQLDPPDNFDGTIAWPGVWTSGENREYIHIITNTADVNYEGQTATVLYFRYNSVTGEWEDSYHLFEEWNSTHYPEIGSNSYCFLQTEKDVVAIVINDPFSDAFVMVSRDNGTSWEQIVFYEHPNPFGTFESPVFYPRYVSGAFDSYGKLHLAYEFNASSEAAGSGKYYPGIGGIVYWNEDMPVRDTTYLSENIYSTTWIYSDATGEMPNEYIGFYLCLDDATGNVIPMSEVLYGDSVYSFRSCGEGITSHGTYNCGPIGMPQMMIDDYDNIYVTWIGIADGFCANGSLSYYRLFGRASEDGGATWKDPIILTKGFEYMLAECIYPYMAQNLVKGKVCVTYQRDTEPGTFVQGDYPTVGAGSSFENFMINPLDFGIVIVDKISDYTANEMEMRLSPNPASSQFIVNVQGTAHIGIYNMLGQMVRNVGNITNEAVVDVTNFASGVYFITATQNGITTTQKLIVQ